VAHERNEHTRLSFTVEWLNLWHRFLRGVYLKFGGRNGPESLAYLPFNCVVYAPDTMGCAPRWVVSLRSETAGSRSAPAEFRFSAGMTDVHLVPRVSVIFVDSAIAVDFIRVFRTRNPGALVVFVGKVDTRDFSLAKEWIPRTRAVVAPRRGGGRSWLQQFS